MNRKTSQPKPTLINYKFSTQSKRKGTKTSSAKTPKHL